MSTPLFSVIIPTYNRADKLRRALDSLAAQTFRDFEVIVCDDGSTDDSREVAVEFEKKILLTYLWEENWGGPARPRNRGLAVAQGVWVCFLDADDWWYANKLERVTEQLGTADVLYHDCDIRTPYGGNALGKHSRQMKAPVFGDLMTNGCTLVTSGVVMRSSILKGMGGFDEERNLIAVEDYDLWLRTAIETERFHHIPEVLGTYWSDDSNISTFSEKYIEREKAVFARHAHKLSPADYREAEILLTYKIGLAKRSMGAFKESRQYFRSCLGSRNIRRKMYASLYYVLSFIGSKWLLG